MALRDTRLIALLDPSLGSKNGGDLIIRDAVESQLSRVLPEGARLLRLPTQRPLTTEERTLAAAAHSFVVGGSNLLASDISAYRQWHVEPEDLDVYDGRVRLMGVGWWQYQPPPTPETQRLLRQVLDDGGHSARDGFTQKQLAEAGLDSLNTSCPTMWDLPDAPESSTTKGSAVVATLTDYARDFGRDRALLKMLRELYDGRVRVWPQGRKDRAYVKAIAWRTDVLPPGIASFEDALDDGDDYVGTRLHAGIRALQRGNRATVVVIDNRAAELAADTGLPVIPRDPDEGSLELLTEPRQTRLHLPRQEIRAWLEETSAWLRR
jgi:hypothetical protein